MKMVNEAIAVIYGGVVGGVIAGLILRFAQLVSEQLNPTKKYWFVEALTAFVMLLLFSLWILFVYG